MALLSARNIPVQIVDANSNLNWAVDTDILNPPPLRLSDNDGSLVVKMQYGDISFLFTGDIETASNNYLVNNYDMNIDVLKVSHHGSINGTTQAFLNEATPAISVISSGNNSFGHPSYTVTEMLQNIGSQIYSTADDWNTWTSTGSSDLTEDDDIVLETDGSHIWKNGILVWTKPSATISTPQNLAVNVSGGFLQVSWDAVSDAVSYQVFGTEIPSATYSNLSGTGTFSTNSGRVIWSVPESNLTSHSFYYVKALK
jgi:hypothetical protein